MALTNAERQARYRERRQAGAARIRYRRPPQQCDDAVRTLLVLQDKLTPPARDPDPRRLKSDGVASIGSGGKRCRNPSPGPRPRGCSSRSAIWTYRYWRPSNCPGASGVTARGSLPGGRERVAAGRPACQRAAHVLRSAPALPGDTPSAPRLGWQLWALRPGLDGASRPSTTLAGRGEPPEVDLHTPFLRGSVFGVARGSVLSVA